MTFAVAASRYYKEVGEHSRGARNVEFYFDWLTKAIGKTTYLTEITNAVVVSLIVKRRGEGVSPSTINRSVIEPLRRVLNRASEIWEEPISKISWKKHRQQEPNGVVRELSANEEKRLFAALRQDYHDITRFALLTGMRLAEFTGLEWGHVDFEQGMIWRERKGGKVKGTPLTPSLRIILERQKGRHETYVFTFLADRARDGRRKGDVLPITYHGFSITLRRALAKAGITNFRIHDFRHTCASRVQRECGDVLITKAVLGHSSIKSTERYAHVDRQDVMEAIEKAARKSPTKIPTARVVGGADVEGFQNDSE